MESPPTLDDLTALEPGLAPLLDEAGRLAPLSGRQLMGSFFGYPGFPRPGFKARLRQLVGWSARQAHPLLLSSAAYDVVYAEVLNALEGKDAARRSAA
jgi:hypothetical protein